MRRTTTRAEIHSPLHSPGIPIPVVMRDCGRFDAVSKTVVGLSVHRGFESLPLRFRPLFPADLQRVSAGPAIRERDGLCRLRPPETAGAKKGLARAGRDAWRSFAVRSAEASSTRCGSRSRLPGARSAPRPESPATPQTSDRRAWRAGQAAGGRGRTGRDPGHRGRWSPRPALDCRGVRRAGGPRRRASPRVDRRYRGERIRARRHPTSSPGRREPRRRSGPATSCVRIAGT